MSWLNFNLLPIILLFTCILFVSNASAFHFALYPPFFLQRLLYKYLHHGDIDRVVCHSKEIGEREGKYYAINVPLKDGIDDASFTRLFKTVSHEPAFVTQ